MVVVVYPPTVDHPAGFFQAQEQFSVEQLVPEFPIERLNVTVLPGATFGDEQRPDTSLIELATDRPSNKFRAAGTDAQRWSAANVIRSATHGEQKL